MSGICGILNRDRSPTDAALLQKMTAFLGDRGPDGSSTWVGKSVGFGHTLLRTTDESAGERQPLTLDGSVWIAADARIDARDELIARLRDRDRLVATSVPDVELILQAYHVWGENCLDYLIGDFAFALWDERQQHLFCARDHFGVKPFFYTLSGQHFIFSNTLDCLHLHPKVCDRLNERAIGDFLLFDFNYELNTTTFEEIQRLPGGHKLLVTAETSQRQRYWTLSLPQPIRYRRREDYLEHFRERMEVAARDRLRTEKVAIFLSGGLDSTTIAAAALDAASRNAQPLDLQAFTIVYDRLIPDRERHYAGLSAQHFGIPIHYLPVDNYSLYQAWDREELQTPEPRNAPLSLVNFHRLQQIARHSRIALYGQGGDEALKPSSMVEVFRGLNLMQACSDLADCLFVRRLRPPLGTGLLNQMRRKRKAQRGDFLYPSWLNPDFARRLNLPQRWREIQQHREPRFDHPPRSLAYQGLSPSPLWNLNFEAYDPGISKVPVEVRLPFLDLRLLDYLLAIPPLPWCIDKELLRVAMRGKLPGSICQRPKTPLAGSPIYEHLANGQQPWKKISHFSSISPYVDARQWQAELSAPKNIRQAWNNLRPLSLAYWLQQRDRAIAFKRP